MSGGDGFDAVMELMAIREGMLEEERTGPAEVVLEAVRHIRILESELADTRVRLAEQSAVRPRRLSGGRPSNRPAAVRASDERHGRSSVLHSDGRPPRASDSALLSSEDHEEASESTVEKELQTLSAGLRPGREEAAVRANGRVQNGASDEHADDRADGPPDEEDPDASLRALMAAAWDGVGGAHTSGTYKVRMGALIPQLRHIAAQLGKEPIALWSESVARFKADPEARRKRLGLPVLCSQFADWTYDVAPANAEPERKPLYLRPLPPAPPESGVAS